MILEMLANTRKRLPDIYSHIVQNILWTDSTQHEQLGTAHDTGGENDFPANSYGPRFIALSGSVLDTSRPEVIA